MNSIIYSNPYVPAELISAHGFQPVRLVPKSCGQRPAIDKQEGVCEFMRMFCCAAAEHPDAAGIVVASTCDQMRRGADILKQRCKTPIFLLDVPSAWSNPSAHRYYRSELERFSGFLGSLGGRGFSYDVLAEAMRGRSVADATEYEPGVQRGIPIALLGGPLSGPDREIFDLIKALGGNVVLDALESGERTQPGRLDRRRIDVDPMGVLADAYFGAIPDVFLRPNSAMYQWLASRLASRGAKGVVVLRYVWCDLWHAEVGRLREWLEIPLLDVDLNGDDVLPRNRTRLEAFLENL